MNLFLKSNFHLIITIEKFSNQLYITTQSKRVISSRYFFQRLNLSQVVLKTNTYRVEKSYYILKKVV